ncbi:IucA/IucC family protein [Saccharopolyspora spinosa]|uniref:IucA/IucC family protein n=1 Tax=Saccharopolyspora spinosa TaxID=60894 RepID=UPI000237B76D|nr:IucA/IucC family protein [Saccharopolyspora spinosa]
MSEESAELVMRDLVDVLLQEDLDGFGARAEADQPAELAGEPLAPGERWCRVKLAAGWVCCRVRPGGALQRYRYSRGPVWLAGGEPAGAAEVPEELLVLASGEPAGAAEVSEDVRAAVEHAEVVLGQRAALDLAPQEGQLLAGERLAATRNRPFHPTARAASGWTSGEVARYGPMRAEPLGLDWVAVRRDRLRFGTDPDSHRLPDLVVDQEGRQVLADVVDDEYLAIPVHPWQFDHLLPAQFGEELATRAIIPLVRGLGRFHPTASIRTLTTAPETRRHVKLPLGMATLGATRLLPPRYLANAERAQECMRELVDRDPVLRRRVALCDERIWCGWHEPADEFGDRPGQLAAQVRVYPELGGLVLPMAALAAHEWDVLAPAISDRFDPVVFFRELAKSFCEFGFAFLRCGVLPELHGQNVVVQLRGARIERFLLRDHDTLRLFPEWMASAGAQAPEYAIKPGAPQSLRLESAESLVGYLQTLGFQVNLYGIADALCRHFGLDEGVLWTQLRVAVRECLQPLPAAVAEVLRALLLHAETWPSREVLGPLLRQGRSSGVSMPAGLGTVPNPLASGAVG